MGRVQNKSWKFTILHSVFFAPRFERDRGRHLITSFHAFRNTAFKEFEIYNFHDSVMRGPIQSKIHAEGFLRCNFCNCRHLFKFLGNIPPLCPFSPPSNSLQLRAEGGPPMQPSPLSHHNSAKLA